MALQGAAELALDAAEFQITMTAGDDMNFSFVVNVNVTDWTLQFSIWLADSNGSGPTGSPLTTRTIGSGITVTPGATSTIAVNVPAAVTTGQANQTLFGELKRTDSGNVRTLAHGPILPI